MFHCTEKHLNRRFLLQSIPIDLFIFVVTGYRQVRANVYILECSPVGVHTDEQLRVCLMLQKNKSYLLYFSVDFDMLFIIFILEIGISSCRISG